MQTRLLHRHPPLGLIVSVMLAALLALALRSAPAASAPASSPPSAPAASAPASSPPSALPVEQTVGLHPILGVQIDTQAQTRGLLVDAIMPGSIAAHMGLEPGDILTEINGVPLDTLETLHDHLRRLRHGDRLLLKYRHGSDKREKRDDLTNVPTLPTYEIKEGLGLPGVIEIGYTRAQLEATLGPPVGEKQGDGVVYLAWPFHGITVALIGGGDAMRVMQFSVEYPLVCRTSRGLVTGDMRSALDIAYKGETIDTRITESGTAIDTVTSLGIQFRSVDGRIRRVSVIPRPAPSASPRQK